MYDIIIIGAGPAGLTAAIYACRSKKKVLVIEKSHYGGIIVNALNIENYPAIYPVSGVEFADKIYKQALDLGAEIILEEVTKIDNSSDKKVVKTNKNEYIGKSVIIATGCDSGKLNIKNEKELIGKGISYCATCDGSFYKGKDVAVVGSGKMALEDALYLSDIVNKVYLINKKDYFKDNEDILSDLKNKNNIEYLYNSKVTKINGEDYLESIELIDSNENKKIINIKGLFVSVGRVPNIDIVDHLVKTDEHDYIIASEDCNTNIPGIFVAGDVRKKELRQLVTATNDGAISAIEAIKYINKRRSE